MSPAYPPLRPFGRARVPAPTGTESAAFDVQAIEMAGVPQPVLMENAGRSTAQILAHLHPEGPVVAVVGAGNNGGDALVVLRTLAAWGREARAILVADRPDGEALLHGWGVPIEADSALDDAGWAQRLAGASVVVDGVLGTGVRGAPRERQAAAIERINAAGRPVVAIDIPSGVDADTGAVPGAAVRAGVTVTYGAPKLGALLHPGRALTGRLVAVEIGFPPGLPASARVVTPAYARRLRPGRGTDTHKNEVGRVVVVAGSSGMAGAALLSARAAFRAGAGLVQLCSPAANREALQAGLPEAIYLDPAAEGVLEEALARAHAVAVGPGLGTDEEAEGLLDRALAAPGVPTVVDADALNLLARRGPGAVAVAASTLPLLLTPHPGEMARLTGRAAEELGADRVAASREAASSWGCAVLLKGAPSLVAAPGEVTLLDTQGSSDLAVGGMGDVLTGVCAALLAQGLTAQDAGALGLHLTGRAATLAGRGRGLSPSDVVRLLPEALVEDGPGSTDLPFGFVLLDMDAAR